MNRAPIKKIRFLFKRYIAISIAGKKEAYKPFQYIYDVEEDITKLFHLGCVDSFVIQQPLRNLDIFADKQNSEEIDGRKTGERYE